LTDYVAWLGRDFPRAKICGSTAIGDSALRREFERAEQDFGAEVEAFIDQNWVPDNPEPSATQRARWSHALVASGWSVPSWPATAGGPGWNPTQKFIWYQACARHGIEVDAGAGVSTVGPLLLQRGTQQQQEMFLPGIRDLSASWCMGHTEPQLERVEATNMAQISTVARVDQGDYLLNGTKSWVMAGTTADWMCCLARLEHEFVLFAVDMHTAGVDVEAVTTLDGGGDMAVVRCVDVRLPKHHLIAGPEDGKVFIRLFSAGEASTLASSAVARAQLDVIGQALATFDTEDELNHKRDALEVDLAGLEVLELRFLDALARNQKPPFPLLLLRLRSRELLMQLGTLQVECFGYYALPYPDELLLHNEGPIGPDLATAATRQALVQQVAALYEGSAEALKDAMASQMGD
jgi:hypothetical protein